MFTIFGSFERKSVNQGWLHANATNAVRCLFSGAWTSQRIPIVLIVSKSEMWTLTTPAAL